MPWSVDISEVIATADAAHEHLSSVPKEMERAGKAMAKQSRDTHLYTNRTGNAERSTQAYTETHGDSTFLLVTIGVPYGSYLTTQTRSFDLTAIEDAVELGQERLEYFVESGPVGFTGG